MIERKELPRPDISVKDNPDRPGGIDLTISRDGKGKTYRIDGQGRGDVIQDTARKILDDPYSSEWLP